MKITKQIGLLALTLALLAVSVLPTSAAPAAQADDDWARVKAAGKILVGTSGDYPPFEFYNSVFQLDGFDIALFQELGKRLGVGVEFNNFAFDGLISALRLKQVDAAIGAISVTPDRQTLVDFTSMYFVGSDTALMRTSSKDVIRSATDMKGKKVGVERGTTYEAWAQENLVDAGLIKQADLVTYDDVDVMVNALRTAKIDVVLIGYLTGQEMDKRYRDVRTAGAKVNQQRYAIAVRKGSTLAQQLNLALSQIQDDGTYDKLAKLYLNVDAQDIEPPSPDVQPTPQPTVAPAPTPAGPAPCEWGMAFVADLNLDDKNMTAPPVMKPGQSFTKSWRVRNVGTCAWEADFQIAFVRGNRAEAQMGGASVAVGKKVQPGETIDLSVKLTAPTVYGTFQAFWQMRTNTRQYFGEVVWVGVQVPDPNPPPPPPQPVDVNPNLRADANWVNQGQCTTVRWDVDNVNNVFFVTNSQAQGVGGHDARSVCPSATTTYILRVVRKDNKSVDFPITINVNGSAPLTINFWADTQNINAGQCTGLNWQVINGKAVYLNQGAGEALVGGSAKVQICPSNTTTYQLRVARNDGGNEIRSVTVSVNQAQPGPVITTFYPDRNEINLGECVNLGWGTANAGGVNLIRSGQTLVQGGQPNSSYQDCPQDFGLYEYVLVAYGNGQTSQKVTVNVQMLPQQ